MNFYIALGGMAGRALKEYSRKADDGQFYYVDTCTPVDGTLEDSDKLYIIPNLNCGTGIFRQIVRSAVKYEMYTGKMNSFFEDIKKCSDANITLVTSSFGGFGSAAVVEFIDWFEYMLYDKCITGSCCHCKVVAFNESMFKGMGFPEAFVEKFKANTIDMVSELSCRTPLDDKRMRAISESSRRVFNPQCRFFVIDTDGYTPDSLHTLLCKSDDELMALDVSNKYTVKAKKNSPSVFISYSSKDQEIADLLVDTLEDRGVDCWIATKSIKEGSYAKQIVQGIREAKIFIVLISANSIASEQVKNEIDRAFSRLKDGLKIIPFIIDDAELDDECAYYLCRQEFYFGKNPPIGDRIGELVEKIIDMLE